MPFDYEQFDSDATRQAIAVLTIYTEAFDLDDFDEADRIVGRIIRDIIQDSKVDKSIVPRFRALLKALATIVDAAHEGLGLDTVEKKLDPLKFFGLCAALDAEDLSLEEDVEEPFD